VGKYVTEGGEVRWGRGGQIHIGRSSGKWGGRRDKMEEGYSEKVCLICQSWWGKRGGDSEKQAQEKRINSPGRATEIRTVP